jgi:chromosome partitioning protein
LVHKPSRPVLLVDADPQGSLTLWHRLRESGEPPIKNGLRNLTQTIKDAKKEGYEWVFVDTAPLMSAQITEAIRNATMVIIPARPSVFDLNAIKETIEASRRANKAFAVVLNGAPPRRQDADAPSVVQARECLESISAPVWAGQVTHRAAFSLALNEGEGVKEFDADSYAAAEIARLWTAIEKSIKAIRGAGGAGTMHKQAA